MDDAEKSVTLNYLQNTNTIRDFLRKIRNQQDFMQTQNIECAYVSTWKCLLSIVVTERNVHAHVLSF